MPRVTLVVSCLNVALLATVRTSRIVPKLVLSSSSINSRNSCRLLPGNEFDHSALSGLQPIQRLCHVVPCGWSVRNRGAAIRGLLSRLLRPEMLVCLQPRLPGPETVDLACSAAVTSPRRSLAYTATVVKKALPKLTVRRPAVHLQLVPDILFSGPEDVPESITETEEMPPALRTGITRFFDLPLLVLAKAQKPETDTSRTLAAQLRSTNLYSLFRC